MKKYWKEILAGSLIAFLIVPLIIAGMLSFRIIVTDTTNEWIGFWGGYLGAIFAGIIALYVLFKTLDDNRKNLERTFDENRRLNERGEIINFCESITDRLKNVDRQIFDVMLSYEKFIYSAREIDKYEAIKTKNICSDEVWGVLIRIDSKKNCLKCCKEIIDDLNEISNVINSFDVNGLSYCYEGTDIEITKKMVNSDAYKKMQKKGKEIAKEIEKLQVNFGYHIKEFYRVNTLFRDESVS